MHFAFGEADAKFGHRNVSLELEEVKNTLAFSKKHIIYTYIILFQTYLCLVNLVPSLDKEMEAPRCSVLTTDRMEGTDDPSFIQVANGDVII